MDLIKNFSLPPFARTQFVSPVAREVWEPRINAAQNAYYRLELETVKVGLRRCTTRHISPAQMDNQLKQLAEDGLVFLPRVKVGSYSGFANSHPAVVEGKPWNWYGPVARRIEDALAFVAAEEAGDHVTIAKLLGFPDCCSAFFTEVWMGGYTDPVWQSALATREAKLTGERQLTVAGDYLWLSWYGTRYNGVRLTPHLPCSLDCPLTLSQAWNWYKLGEELELDGLDDLRNILEMPTQWDCLHGLLQVTTPVFRIVTNSTPSTEQFTIRKEGQFIPEEAASGLVFPFRQQ